LNVVKKSKNQNLNKFIIKGKQWEWEWACSLNQNVSVLDIFYSSIYIDILYYTNINFQLSVFIIQRVTNNNNNNNKKL